MRDEQRDTFWCVMDGQEKVETPTGGIAGNVWTYATVETSPTLVCVYVAERVPDLLSDTTVRLGSRRLELDFEEVEGVHAENGDDACAEPCCGMVLREGEWGDGE